MHYVAPFKAVLTLYEWKHKNKICRQLMRLSSLLNTSSAPSEQNINVTKSTLGKKSTLDDVIFKQTELPLLMAMK